MYLKFKTYWWLITWWNLAPAQAPAGFAVQIWQNLAPAGFLKNKSGTALVFTYKFHIVCLIMRICVYFIFVCLCIFYALPLGVIKIIMMMIKDTRLHRHWWWGDQLVQVVWPGSQDFHWTESRYHLYHSDTYTDMASVMINHWLR